MNDSLIGAVPLSGFFPHPDADDSAREVADMYLRDLDAIRAGCAVMAIASALFLPWGLTIAVYTRHAEPGCRSCSTPRWRRWRSRRWSSCSSGVLGRRLVPSRRGRTRRHPELERAGWFGILFTWPPFSVWCAAIASSIFTDRREVPPYPRWAGYLNVWTAILYGPACGMIVTKTGPLSWSGVICFWIPVVVFVI